ncbi:hypothetical protein [Actinomadura chibensis]|uniref:Uncharacterized protein n=1 Tax=Actinomadura chibensis TaxID=392828 RepID=A0A5D0NY62_9ACTN|nr:hypothetical protein [Actinomadura chibensis]TYB49406.1 hypothetical protein FXF69_10055 [Actinomadura chibensis]
MSDHHQAGHPGGQAARLDRRTAERLLRRAGRPSPGAAPPDPPDPLDALLAAAAAPARPGELAGEDAAVAAFRAVPRPARPSRAAALRRLLTIKVVAIVGGSLVLTGGAAYATITGRLPGHSPAPPASPSGYDRDGHRSPPTRYTPGPPPSSRRPATPTPAPTPSVTEKQHGKANAPGQQKQDQNQKTKPPRKPHPTPSRGPGYTKNPSNGNPGNGIVKGEEPSQLSPGKSNVVIG